MKVSYEDNIGKIKFGGSISRSKDIKEVLEVLKLTGIHFNLKGKRMPISACCNIGQYITSIIFHNI
ncbi:DUF4974 domain-containing protein [Sphingobacterium detergens]|uniref:DUF4974 domain-containing protein n=1 Tax=Sphingobacterium detergens TaxID=1145106 RepID=UPI003AADECEB